MLKKINRISKTRDLQKVYRFGKTVHTSTLVIKFSANPRLKANTLRAAFVVSKKVSKKAVERNRIKRALRETMRTNLTMCAIGEYMIVTKPNCPHLFRTWNCVTTF